MKRIDENHSFNINVACIVGERKAILLKEQYGWCLKNLHNDRNIHAGHAWTYNSAKAYAQKFPYWNPKSISRWLKEMEDEGWIASANLNKVAFDRTKWYTVNFRRYDLAVTGCDMKIEDIETWKKEIKKSISQNEEWNDQNEEWNDQNEESDFSKTDNQSSQNEEPIPPLTTSYPSREPERENTTAQNTAGINGFNLTPPPCSAPPPSPALPPEEQAIQAAIANAKAYMEQWPAMRPHILEGARLRESEVDFEKELESWIRHHGNHAYYLNNITKSISSDFARWMVKAKQFNHGRQGQVSKSSNKHKEVKPGVADRVQEQAKRRGITVLS